jgi:hypothetical protein
MRRLKMNTGLSGPDLTLSPGDEHEFEDTEAERLIEAGFGEELIDAAEQAAAEKAAAEKVAAEQTPATAAVKPLSAMTKAELIGTAKNEGVAIETDDNKADLIAKIEQARN